MNLYYDRTVTRHCVLHDIAFLCPVLHVGQTIAILTGMAHVCLDTPIHQLPQLTHFGHCEHESGRSFDPHRHLGYEIIYIHSGRPKIRIFPGEKPESFEPDDVIVISPGVEHEFAIDRCNAEYYWLGVQTEPVVGVAANHILPPGRLVRPAAGPVEFVEQSAEFRALAHLCESFCLDRWALIRRAPELSPIFDELYRDIRSSDPYRVYAVFGRLLEMLSVLRRRLDPNEKSLGRTELGRYAVDYVRAHAGEAVTLDMVAKHLGVHVTHASRLFKRETKKTFSEFLLAERIRVAKQMLLGGARIGAVAGRVGFSSISTLSRAFRKVTGVTASQYRSAARSETAAIASTQLQ